MARPANTAVGTKSLSKIVPQETRIHEWSIEGLTLDHILKASPREEIISQPFEALGLSWHLNLTLDNRSVAQVDEKKPEQIGYFLVLLTPGKTISVDYEVQLGASGYLKATDKFSTVEPAGTVDNNWGWAKDHSVLRSSPGTYFVDGVLTISVKLTASGFPNVTNGPVISSLAIPIVQASLAADLAQLLSGTRGSPADVKLRCSSGESVPAHSVLLTLRSSVFAAQLATDNPLAPVEFDKVPVPPEITSATIRRMLEFLYTDDLEPSSAEEAQHLLNAADHYQLPRLVAICERALYDQLTVENVAFTLTLAAQHRASALERQAILFAAREITAVLRTDGWAHLSAARPELKDKILHALATGEVPENDDELRSGAGEGGAAAGGGEAGGSGSEASLRRSKRQRR